MRAPLNWRTALLFVPVLVAVLLVGWTMRPEGARPPVRLGPGDVLTVDRAGLAKVDLERVHGELIPGWVVSRGGMRNLQARELERALAPDRNLVAIAARMHQLTELDPVLNGAELLGLVATWNAYLDRAGVPWRMEGDILLQQPRSGDLLALRTYRVIFDGQTRVGTAVFRTRLQRRADDTTLMESFLGHVRAGDEGVLLLHDRIRDYALDEVWTLLDGQGHTAVEKAFAPALQEAVRTELGGDAGAVLATTASHRRAMLDVVRSIHERHACGSQFLVSRVPWSGFDASDLARLDVHAAAAASQDCPDVTPEEAARLAASTAALRSEPTLKDALERLTAWVAGAVVIHEARHAADVARSEPLVCEGCPPSLDRVGVLETSAYVASFAAPGRGVVGLFQACELDPRAASVQVVAMDFVMDKLGSTCVDGPPPDLVPRARGLEVELFGRYTPVDIEDFPVGLPVGEHR